MQTVTKEKIAVMLKQQLGLSGVICEELVDSIFSQISALTIKNNKFRIKNFGSFSLILKKSRPARNINKNETIIIPSRQVIRFSPARDLKNVINGSDNEL